MNYGLEGLLLLLFASLTAYLAHSRGRDPFFWFVVGLFASFLGPLLVVILPPVKKAKAADEGGYQDTFEGTTISVTPLEEETTSLCEVKQPEKYQWFYLDGNRRQQGPISFVSLKHLVEEGVIQSDTYLWCEAFAEWHRYKHIVKAFQSTS